MTIARACRPPTQEGVSAIGRPLVDCSAPSQPGPYLLCGRFRRLVAYRSDSREWTAEVSRATPRRVQKK